VQKEVVVAMVVMVTTVTIDIMVAMDTMDIIMAIVTGVAMAATLVADG
jgi:hypothetical protein